MSRSGPGYWLPVGAAVLGALAAGVWLAWWVFLNVIVYVTIEDQPVGLVLPQEFGTTATVTNELDVTLDGEITAAVPFKQELTVPFRGRYDFDVEFSAKVPVEFEVLYDGTLPVDTVADVTIRTGLNYKNLKSLRNLEIQTRLPLKFQLPVRLQIPVRDTIDLTYAGPLAADIDQDLKAVVDTTLRARLPVNQTVRAPVTAAIPLRIRPSQEQTRLIISSMVVALRPSTMLKASIAGNRDGPVRVENPYGPDDRVPAAVQ